MPPVAPPLFHNCSIPIGPKTGRLNVGEHRKADVDPFHIERGSSGLVPLRLPTLGTLAAQRTWEPEAGQDAGVHKLRDRGDPFVFEG